MALYLGNSDKLKIILDNTVCCINLFSALPTIEDVLLSSLDDCLLKDFDGLYLTFKESEQ